MPLAELIERLAKLRQDRRAELCVFSFDCPVLKFDIRAKSFALCVELIESRRGRRQWLWG
jgi:hypothetical protein